MTRDERIRLCHTLPAWNAAQEAARAAYGDDPSALSTLLDTPCASCRHNRHGDCTDRVRVPGGRGDSIPCGCRELGHPRQTERSTP